MGSLIIKDEAEEVQAIVAFVKSMQSPKGIQKGVQFGEIRTHFKWGQDKWVKHWKKAKLYLDKKKLVGWAYPRYFVKKKFGEEAKTLLFSQEFRHVLENDEINEIAISETKVEEAIKKEMERLQPMFAQIGWEEQKKAINECRQARELVAGPERKESIGKRFTKAVLRKSPSFDVTPENFKTHPLYTMALAMQLGESEAKIRKLETEMIWKTIASFVKVHIVYDKTEPLPSLDEQDMANLLRIVIKNVPAEIKKPWYLIATCSIPEEAYVQ